MEIGETLGPGEVICDVCNAEVTIRPVPVVNGYAAVPGASVTLACHFPDTLSRTTLPKRWRPVIEEHDVPHVSVLWCRSARRGRADVGASPILRQAQDRLYEDGFDPSEGGAAVNEIVSVSCPRCKWGGDARYYEAGVLPGQVPVHFHIGAAAGTAGEVYEEYAAHYVAPQPDGDSPTWLLTDWEGETEVSRFPTLLEAVREALRLLREELGEETEPTCGAGAPPAAILQLALE